MSTLLQNFYKELSSDYSEQTHNNFNCTIKLDPEHEIYKGHFGNIKIAPGVCMVQVIKELVSRKYSKNLFLSSADNIKFLVLINPETQSEFNIHFQVTEKEGGLEVSATYSWQGLTYLKFKGRFNILTEK